MSKRLLLALASLSLAALILPNTRSLYEGVFFYLRDAISYNSAAVEPVSRAGRYASLYDLVQLRNVERYAYLLRHLDLPNISVTPIPIPNSRFSNLFVRFNSSGPYTIYSAHYDKLYDTPEYQGASDNTAALSVLLASIEELAMRADGGNRAFLFTGEEEKGLLGARAFTLYAHANQIAIRANVNFDNLGRGKLAIRPSVERPGFVFTLPLYGDITYDGRALRRSDNLRQVESPALLVQALLRVQPDIVVYERFTALSDSNVFQENGIDTVAISGDDMYYLEQTWHTYADRVELLDERNLDRAYELVMGY